MSLFPSESYSFPDLSEGAKPKRRKRGVSPEPSAEPEDVPTASSSAPVENATSPAPIVEEEAPLSESPPAASPVQPPAPIRRAAIPRHLARRIRMRPVAPNEQVESPPAPVKPVMPAAPAAAAAPVRPERPPKRVIPVMPVMPVVPDELAQNDSDYIEPEPEPIKAQAPVKPPVPPAPARPIRPPKRVLPLMPVMPVVPDELAESGSTYIESEPEPIDEPPEFDVPDYAFMGMGEDRSGKKRRRNKLIRFIIFEALAFGLLLVSAKLVVNEQFSESSLALLYKVLMFTAAVTVVIIPVVFYALPPTLPPTRR